MKFYIASHNGMASDGMSYKELGGHEDLNSSKRTLGTKEILGPCFPEF